MSSGFPFGANKPAEAPAFGQPAFGGAQQAASSPFGIATSNVASLPQFSSTFGGTTGGGFQFSSPTTTASTFSTPAFNFNNPSAQPTLKPTTLNFGAPTPNSLTSQTQNLFGSPSVPAPAPAPNASSLFGTPKGANLSFNTPTLTSPNTALSFGTATSTPASTGGLFGTTTATTANPGFPFPLSSTAKTVPAFGSSSTPGYNFSGPPTTSVAGTNLAFGSATAPGTGIPFGGVSTAPSSGLTFGTAAAVPSTGLTFGTPSTTPNTGLAFGAISTGPTTGISFGGGSTIASTGSTFGPTATASATGIPFGPTATAATMGIPFGPTPVVPSTGITLGGGLAFGPPATAQSSGITFSAASAPNTGINFGVPQTVSSSGLMFAATPTAPRLSFSTTTTASLGKINSTSLTTSASIGGLPFATIKSTASSGTPSSLFGTTAATGTTPTALSFSTSLPSTIPATLSFSTPLTKPSSIAATTTTGATAIPITTTIAPATTAVASTIATTTAGSGYGFSQNLISSTATSTGLGGIKLPTTAPVFNILAQTTSITTPATTTSVPQHNVGLGGISSTPPKHPPTGTNLLEQTETAPKDQILPNELLQTVEHFKKFVQEQKSFSSEIARFSVRDLKRVEGDIDLVNNYINELESDLQKNKAIAEKLKGDTARGLQHVEMAQRTLDTPAGLQYDNTAPLNYFIELTDNFERDMYVLKVHIENIDKCVRNTGLSETLTSQDLALGMRRLHETFVALAGRLQSVHNQVELQKEQYLTVRKQLLNDYTNVFEERSKQIDTFDILDKVPYQPPILYTGPTPFNSLGNSQAQALAQNLPPSYPGASIGLPPSGFNMGGPSTVPLFGSNISGTSSLFNASASFQLQKPPVGNKRGKQ